MPSPFILIAIVALAGLAMFSLNACSKPTVSVGASIPANTVILDVRTPGEFAGGHLEGAINLPVDQIGSAAKVLSDKSTPVVVYCASGGRSRSARIALMAAGHTQVDDAGGIGNAAKVLNRAVVR
jgi:phage shock protein E